MITIHPFEPLKILTQAHQVETLKRGEISRPIMGLLYPSMACNQGCSWCHDLWRHSPKAFMPTETIKEVLADMAMLGCRGIELCGGGEPLMHPDIMNWVSYGQSLGLRFGVLTNGAVRNDDLMVLMARSFAYVRISCDYADPEKYAATRQTTTHQFRRMRDNIRLLLSSRGENDCQVSLKATLHRQTPDDVDEFIAMGAGLDVSSIQVKKVEDTVRDGLDTDLERKACIVNVLEAWQKIFTEQQQAGGGAPRLLWNFGDRARLTHRCWIHPIHVFVSTDGSVEACCYGHGRHERHTFGNVFRDRLRDIWGSEAHRCVMAGTDPDECNRFSCRFIGHMKTLDEAAMYGQTEFV